MMRLLARLLIRNHENTRNPEVRRAYGMLCGAVGIVLNTILFAAKYLAGTLTGSIAMTADAFNNLSDAGSSAITLIGFRISGRHNDKEHPFGHGRVEYLAGLIISLIIILMGVELGRSSIAKIFAPEPVNFSVPAALVLAGAILVKLYMARYNRAIGVKIHSASMRAAAMDSLSDAAATSAVLLSGLIGHFFGVNIDAHAGLLVSVLILHAGFSAAKDTANPLLGSPPDPAFVRRVYDIVKQYDAIQGVHDLVVHDYGAGQTMISLHAEVPGGGDLMRLHDVIDTVERRLAKDLGCRAVIHMDPLAADDSATARAQEQVLTALRVGLDDRVTIHDFRMISEPTHTNIFFDAVIPMEINRSDADLQTEITRMIREMSENYRPVVTIDRPLACE